MICCIEEDQLSCSCFCVFVANAPPKHRSVYLWLYLHIWNTEVYLHQAVIVMLWELTKVKQIKHSIKYNEHVYGKVAIKDYVLDVYHKGMRSCMNYQMWTVFIWMPLNKKLSLSLN